MAHKYPQLDDREWLRRHYVRDGQSCRKIARILGCDEKTVRTALRKHGISARNPSRPSRQAIDTRHQFDKDRTRPSFGLIEIRIGALFQSHHHRHQEPHAYRDALVDLAAACEGLANESRDYRSL